MPLRDTVADRLRAYVRERVRKDGRFYEWGNATRLAEHLKVDSGWVTLYTDDKPIRHADVDEALAICDFFGVDLLDFQAGGPRLSKAGSTVAPAAKGDPHHAPQVQQRRDLREIAALKTRIVRLEIALRQVR